MPTGKSSLDIYVLATDKVLITIANWQRQEKI